MAEIFTRTYEDGKVVDSMLNPDRLDALYEKIRDIHKKEFPDWSISQVLQHLIAWDSKFQYEWLTDEQFTQMLQAYADEMHKNHVVHFDEHLGKFDPEKPIITQETTCTENP